MEQLAIDLFTPQPRACADARPLLEAVPLLKRSRLAAELAAMTDDVLEREALLVAVVWPALLDEGAAR